MVHFNSPHFSILDKTWELKANRTGLKFQLSDLSDFGKVSAYLSLVSLKNIVV